MPLPSGIGMATGTSLSAMCRTFSSPKSKSSTFSSPSPLAGKDFPLSPSPSRYHVPDGDSDPDKSPRTQALSKASYPHKSVGMQIKVEYSRIPEARNDKEKNPTTSAK
jgi:hypothetical protein